MQVASPEGRSWSHVKSSAGAGAALAALSSGRKMVFAVSGDYFRKTDECTKRVFVRTRFPVTLMVCTMREFLVMKEHGLEKPSVIKTGKPPEAEVPTFYFSVPLRSLFIRTLFGVVCLFFIPCVIRWFCQHLALDL